MVVKLVLRIISSVLPQVKLPTQLERQRTYSKCIKMEESWELMESRFALQEGRSACKLGLLKIPLQRLNLEIPLITFTLQERSQTMMEQLSAQLGVKAAWKGG